MKEEIDHVDNVYCIIGYPGCYGIVECVYIP
jgi:hypothetical protein